MIISGLNSNFIYPQNQATWSLNLTTAQDLSGKYFSLYFSGNNNYLEIVKLKNNKIYDKDNYLIGNYSNDTKINFSGKISENKYTLYQNNVLLFDGKDKTSFNFDSFIFNTNGSFVDVENFSIWGVRPKFYINGFTSSDFAIQTANNQTTPILNYSYLDNSLPLNIYNGGSSSLYIYSGVSNNTDFYIPLLTPIIIPPYTTVSGISNNTEFPISVPAPIIIPPYTTGVVNIINNSFVFGQSTIPIILYSNVGNINLSLQVSGTKPEEEVYYFSFGPKITYINNKTSQNYNLTFFNKQNPVNLNIELNYISGITGAIYKEIEYSNLYTESKQVSGFISGAGYLYSDVVTGIVQNFNSLTDELNGLPYYYNKLETGLGSGVFSKYKTAEDQNLYYTYEIYASGYGNGILLTDIPSTGLQQITYSGYLTYLGGYLTGEACGSTTGIIPNAKRGWTYNEQGKFVPPVLKENIFALVCKYRPELSICHQAVNIYNYEYASGDICGRSIIYMPYTGQIKAEYPDTDLISIDLISPFLTVTGHFQGFLDIFGIALATGDRISGVAIGDFAKDIEPGFYNFYKNWSGILTGKSFLNWTGAGFNPVSAESTNYSTFNANSNFLQLGNVSDSLSVLSGLGKETTTGFFVGEISESGILELCSPMLPDAIRVVGTPSVIGSVGDQNPNIVYTNQKEAFIVMPNLYFEEIKYENSQYLLTGLDAHLYYGYPSGGRTRISRLGNTSSGSGKFDNVFQLPNFSGFSYQKTDENGNLLFKLKLDNNGNPIPRYSTAYECMPLTGANGSPVTGENGQLITGADGNFVPQPLVINGSPILKQKTDSNGNPMFDSSGFPILDYTCQPLLGANGQPVFLPILDANGDQVYEEVPDLETISKDFVGWSETLFVNTGIVYSDATPPSIKNIDINCYLFDPCDISIINFKIDKPNFFYSGATELDKKCFEGCFENWPKQIFENTTSGIISGYNSLYSLTGTPNNPIQITICDDAGLKYFKFYDRNMSLSSSSSSQCFIVNKNTNFSFAASPSDPYGLLISGINTNARKRSYIQGIDSMAAYSQGFINTYGSLIVWDGEQDGTIFKIGDQVKFIAPAFSDRLNINSIYQVLQIVQDIPTPNFPNSQALLVGCLQPLPFAIGEKIIISNNDYYDGNYRIMETTSDGKHYFECWPDCSPITYIGEELVGSNPFSNFGQSLDINNDGNILVVGAAKENFESEVGPKKNVGFAYIYNRYNNNNWYFAKRISGRNLTSFGEFGKSVAIDNGNCVAVGEPFFRNSNQEFLPFDRGYGAVHLFTGQKADLDWNWDRSLYGASIAGSEFGYSIDLNNSGDVLVVGAPKEVTNNITGGAVYVYCKLSNGWKLDGKITGSLNNQLFGHSVKINSGNRIAVKATNNAYIYDYTGNLLTLTRNISTTQYGNILPTNFNKTIDINLSGNRLLVGSPNTGYGLARLFAKGTNNNAWYTVTTFTGQSGYFNYGASVGLDTKSNRILIGAPDENMVYIYTGASFTFHKKIGYNQFNSKDLSRCASPVSGIGNCVAINEDSNYFAFGGYLSGPNEEGSVLVTGGIV
jgi:hypothetical protein